MPSIPIDKDIPLPGQSYRSDRVKYPFASMAVGDSFVVSPSPGQTVYNLLCSLRRCSRLPSRAHLTFLIVRVTPPGSLVESVRVWRTK